MQTTDQQVRKLMSEMNKHGRLGLSAARSGMHRHTARKYLRAGQFPSELRVERHWRTRADPFSADWPDLLERLEAAPELEAKSLFEDLLERHPDRYSPGQVRTLQRRVKVWRAQYGPPKEVFFPQEHRPGERMQTDFTWATSLGVTLCGEPFAHLLCHMVLPHSNWEWATVCQSESMMALRKGVQSAVFELGSVPEYHQTDNSTAATHNLRSGKRGFNEEYLALMRHLSMKPATTDVGAKEQNGDVEASHGVLKRRLEQHLLLRGSRDFDSREEWEGFVQDVCRKANALRHERLSAELSVMRELSVVRLAEHKVLEVRVSGWSTVRVKRNSYSVPSRLIGEKVKCHVYDDRVEVWYTGSMQLSVERLLGEQGHRVNYRHIIWWLVRKPGAFERYRYREDLFPSLVFRRGYDALCGAVPKRRADIEYLRCLHLAATTMESEVETALELLLADGAVPRFETVKGLVVPQRSLVPELSVGEPDLADFDELLEVVR